MIGKASLPREKHLHAGLQNRFSVKYRGLSYTRMIGLVLLDGTAANAQNHAWQVEAQLHARLQGHAKWDKVTAGSHSGKAVTKSHDQYLFNVYLALK